MKTLFGISFLLLSYLSISAQAPQAISYQAVLRDANGQLLSQQSVGLSMGLRTDSLNGPLVYEEHFFLTTNDFGLVHLAIGTGAVQSGQFESLAWADHRFFLEVKMDATGGTNFVSLHTSQLLSVPYALYADRADTARIAENAFSGDYQDLTNAPQNLSQFTNDAGFITQQTDPDPTNELQQLSLNGDTIFLSQSNYIVIPGLSQLNTGANLNIQQRLDTGETPLSIVNGGEPVDSLYGKSWAGGLIFQLDSLGSGHVAAAMDQGAGEWGCYGVTINNANATALGQGAVNTPAIVSGCPTAGIAAAVCQNLSLNGYSDWFLPARDALVSMYQNLHLKGYGGFSPHNYWSSTQGDGLNFTLFNGSATDFGVGSTGIQIKVAVHRIRAIRKF
ncbi:MAG: hypothetical protein AAFR61_19770 [Bacteroidota bacterium]